MNISFNNFDAAVKYAAGINGATASHVFHDEQGLMKTSPFDGGIFRVQNERYVSFTKEFGRFLFEFGVERDYDFINEEELPCEYKLVINFRPVSNNIEDILFGTSTEYFSFSLKEILSTSKEVIEFIKQLKEEYIIHEIGYEAYDLSPVKRQQKIKVYNYFLSKVL